jgi:hypothetical protein
VKRPADIAGCTAGHVHPAQAPALRDVPPRAPSWAGDATENEKRTPRALFAAAVAAVFASPAAAFAAEAAQAPATQVTDAGSQWLVGAAAAGAAILAWLKIKDHGTRKPPVQEELYRDYVRREEFVQCQGICRKDSEAIRIQLAALDSKDEDRTRGTHARIDTLFRESQRTNRAVGKLLGVLIGQGKAPAAMLAETGEDL